jgi:crossover junction endodeoxyribonuclease RuvC
MIILGIDPALTKTGWGVIFTNQNTISFIASGTIQSDATKPLCERLLYIYNQINQVISIYKPDEVAIEETFVNKNAVSSLKLGHARGALMVACAVNNLKIYEYASTAVKKTIVGVGRAEKNQIGAMIKYLLPKANFKNNDEADALAIAICHNNQKAFYLKKFI